MSSVLSSSSICGVIVLLFLGCGLALVWLAGQVLWHGVLDVGQHARQRAEAGPTVPFAFRGVVVVALAVESLIAVFYAASDSPGYLPHTASIALAAAVLLAAWGLFVHVNRGAKEMEPESILAPELCPAQRSHGR